jgi:hypothetical protein
MKELNNCYKNGKTPGRIITAAAVVVGGSSSSSSSHIKYDEKHYFILQSSFLPENRRF